MRGAAIAMPGSSPNASMRNVTCTIDGWMYCDPAAPTTRRTAPLSSTIVGAMVVFANRFVPRVRASKLLADELRKNPSVYTPDPNSTPTVVVAETALPSPSTIAMCDVRLSLFGDAWAPASKSPGAEAERVAGAYGSSVAQDAGAAALSNGH